MRKHPVIFGICLLILIGMVFFAVVYGLSLFKGEGRSLTLRGKVGIVPIEGSIVDAREIIDQITEFSDDSGIRAVVLRIDSPGGGVAASQEIYQAVIQLRTKKKVVVSMGAVAASGGYLIATAADRIMANPGTITGSISAVMHFANVEELLKKVGVKSSVVKSGKFKDIGSPTREMTSEERELFQGIVDDIYDQLVTTISENRKIPLEKVVKLADGRIFSGRQALDLDLVDELGGLQDAVLLAGKLSNIEGKPAVVHAVKKRTSLWKYLLENMASVVAEKIGPRAAPPPGVHYLFE
ncbi:MAG: multidrug transporter [Syntrophobacterales bacterium RBG_19FT_COMBO_59_10]|nr:MAG: multidrug transporter [Syntrophobacterales bacterium RBG_19FT_COMBO_59_10]